MAYAEDWDAAGKMSNELWPKADAMGCWEWVIPKKFGGVSDGIDS